VGGEGGSEGGREEVHLWKEGGKGGREGGREGGRKEEGLASAMLFVEAGGQEEGKRNQVSLGEKEGRREGGREGGEGRTVFLPRSTAKRLWLLS
jgi:hypothetical protein